MAKQGGRIYFNGFSFNNSFDPPLEGDIRVAYLRGDFDELTEVPEESAFTHRYSIYDDVATNAAKYYQICEEVRILGYLLF